VARQLLLHEDSMDLVDGNQGLSARLEPTSGLNGTRTPYQRYLDDIRGAAFKILSLREYPMSTRHFLLAYLGKQTASFFHRDASAVDEARLAQVIDQVTQPGTVAALHRELASVPRSEALTANLVSELISERMKFTVSSFRSLVDDTLQSYGDVTNMPLAEIWAEYARRRDAWLEVERERIDLYFENDAKNYWLREWYVMSQDLLAHTQRLLVRVAVQRFLLFSHPSLKEVPADPAARRELLDKAAVSVFYRFSRGIEHDPKFLTAMTARLLDAGTSPFTQAAMLALG